MNQKKINTFFSTLNFVLFFVGYQLTTSLFLPISSDIEGVTRSVTIPYRAFTLLISLLVILLNIKEPFKEIGISLKVFLFYWLLLIIRIFYDTEIRTDIQLSGTSQLWLYIFGICLPAIFSIIRSYQEINLKKALVWIYTGVVITLLLSLFSNQTLFAETEDARLNANVGLQTIAYGHLGVMGIILSLFIFQKKNNSILTKIITLLVIFISIYATLRAGSRGPILALFAVILFWFFAHGKNVLLGILSLIIISGVTILFIDPILGFIGNIAPLLETRLRSAIFEGNITGRDLLYDEAWQIFFDHPILGGQFALFKPDGTFIYSHNLITDVFMGLGIIGGICMIYFLWKSALYSYRLIKNRDSIYWIGLVFIQQVIFNMVSGAFYYNQLLNALIPLILIYYRSTKTYK
ncbi:O-antigen ligase [Parabacteroides sp. Marseille-P3160]|uniref:O-antigen ligase family protein n=1 Tax=Parabacteroides sp. Marseille-P3160 TaxID=1917887 RepID=UPI0009BAC507|nr:O-antigen ligase family protein [Parabacteroides sp. Marseille-P3160]